MELFRDREHVRLRSREVVGAYLHADEDGWGVSLSPRRASLNTAWAVHLLPLPHLGATYVLLHSAAYGRYLGVGGGGGGGPDHALPQPQGHPVGFLRMIQRQYNTPEQANVMWEAVGTADGDAGVFLRCPAGNHHLVNSPWTVEAIPPRLAPPQLTDQIPNGVVAPVVLSRQIRYIRADNYGIFILPTRGTLQFSGRSLHYLISDLAHQLNDNFDNITLCVRSGFLGRITPLVVDLPLGEDTIDIVVLTTGSTAAMALRHPNVDAP